ncbi:hypothetical protein TELCIR_05858, partial [Teladorsagia circumcincta]
DLSLCDPEADSIYMCGNSLGLMPKATERIMKEQLDKWAKMGVFGHRSGELPWAFCDEHAIEGVAQLVGAKPEEIALCNGLTVNIHVLLVRNIILAIIGLKSALIFVIASSTRKLGGFRKIRYRSKVSIRLFTGPVDEQLQLGIIFSPQIEEPYPQKQLVKV